MKRISDRVRKFCQWVLDQKIGGDPLDIFLMIVAQSGSIKEESFFESDVLKKSQFAKHHSGEHVIVANDCINTLLANEVLIYDEGERLAVNWPICQEAVSIAKGLIKSGFWFGELEVILKIISQGGSVEACDAFENTDDTSFYIVMEDGWIAYHLSERAMTELFGDPLHQP